MDIENILRRVRGVFGNALVWGVGWLTLGLVLFAGLFLPLFLQTMNLLSGSGLVPWEMVLDDVLLTAFLGGTAAGGSMKLAQLTDALSPGGDQDHLEGRVGAERLRSGEEG